MDEKYDVLPISALTGKSVLSLATGNKLGQVDDLFIDAVNGIPIGLTVTTPDRNIAELDYDEIHSFGHDAIMAASDASIANVTETPFGRHPHARQLIGTKIITEGGNLLGEISNIFVTLNQPLVVYAIRETMLDKLLGRELFILASAGYALSNDAERLVVPNDTAATAAQSIATLLERPMSVHTYSGPDDTAYDEDQTFVTPRSDDEFETILHSDDDDDDTVIHLRRDPHVRPT
jgi:uncharacterized protein YrrD